MVSGVIEEAGATVEAGAGVIVSLVLTYPEDLTAAGLVRSESIAV